MQWEGENSPLTDGWWDSYIFPKGWILKMILAGETLNIFLLVGISNKNIFFIKKKKHVFVYSNLKNEKKEKNTLNNFFFLIKNKHNKILIEMVGDICCIP